MVIKVDFDLTMSILAHNLYRLFAQDLEGYTHCADMAIYEKFLNNSGVIKMTPDSIHVALKKKRNLPLLLTSMQKFQNMEIHSLGNRKIFFSGLSSS